MFAKITALEANDLLTVLSIFFNMIFLSMITDKVKVKMILVVIVAITSVENSGIYSLPIPTFPKIPVITG